MHKLIKKIKLNYRNIQLMQKTGKEEMECKIDGFFLKQTMLEELEIHEFKTRTQS